MYHVAVAYCKWYTHVVVFVGDCKWYTCVYHLQSPTSGTTTCVYTHVAVAYKWYNNDCVVHARCSRLQVVHARCCFCRRLQVVHARCCLCRRLQVARCCLCRRLQVVQQRLRVHTRCSRLQSQQRRVPLAVAYKVNNVVYHLQSPASGTTHVYHLQSPASGTTHVYHLQSPTSQQRACTTCSRLQVNTHVVDFVRARTLYHLQSPTKSTTCVYHLQSPTKSTTCVYHLQSPTKQQRACTTCSRLQVVNNARVPLAVAYKCQQRACTTLLTL